MAFIHTHALGLIVAAYLVGQMLGFFLAAALCGQGRNHGERDV